MHTGENGYQFKKYNWRNKELNEVKPIENINNNYQSF